MSLSQIRPVDDKFISDNHNDLLVIKGGWGVGKTYFWQDIIRRASAAKSIGRTYYSYVSLFGINSLEDLKNSILAARVGSKSANTEDGIKAVLAGAKQLLKGAENAPFLREWTGGMASTALFLLLAKDTLVCFDDIERRGDGLATKDLLGLASLLKEQRNCKIVFILNDGSMPEDEQNNFRRHGEKIIDVEVEFSPLPEEAFDYAFTKVHPYYEFIRSGCLDLRIKNIRILQRINRFAEVLLPHLKGSETTVVEEALRSLILYLWCYYDKDNGTPPLSYVRSFNYIERFIREQYQEKNEESAEEKRWGDLLRLYGYSNTDEVDQHIAALVEKGYLEEAAFSLELEKKNATSRAQQAEHSYTKAWDLFNNSFDNNEQEFVAEMAVSFRLNIMHLSVANLHNTVQVLRDLGQDDPANALIDEYFDQHADDSTLMKMRRSAFLDELKDPYLNERLRAAWQPAEDKRTLAEVVKDLTGRNGWSPEDIELLINSDIDDYYRFFMSENSDNLYHYVRTCLRFGENENTNELLKAIAGKAKEALKKIASESRINRVRISGMFKIDVDESQRDS